MNYLTLVNETIREAGITLDALTSSDFASTTDPMKVRFKNWVAQAWREIQMDRGEWEFLTKEANVIISPRMYVELGDRATAPASGYTYTTTETDVDFEVVGVTTLSGDWSAGTAAAYIDFIDATGAFKFNETADETSPTSANLDVFTIRDWGRYDLSTLVDDLDEPNVRNFFIQETGGSSDQDNTSSTELTPLPFIAWDTFRNNYENSSITGKPILFTQAPNGDYDVYPRPDKQYLLKFSYVTAPVGLSAYTDTPVIDDKFQWAIVWRAVMFWAQYDRQVDAESRAFKNYRFYKRQLDKYLKPKFTWGRSRFDG